MDFKILGGGQNASGLGEVLEDICRLPDVSSGIFENDDLEIELTGIQDCLRETGLSGWSSHKDGFHIQIL